MSPFDLGKAMSGEPVQTKLGVKVRLTGIQNRPWAEPCPIKGIVSEDLFPAETSWDMKGKNFDNSDFDLQMVSDKDLAVIVQELWDSYKKEVSNLLKEKMDSGDYHLVKSTICEQFFKELVNQTKEKNQ